MSKVFIGMPVFNGEKYISKALDSLIAQTYTDWTLLISDNKSTDSTADICKKYTQIDSRITYHCQSKNVGPMNNFKYLLEKSNQNWFMWAASDDLWEPEFIRTCVSGLANGAGLSFSNIMNVDASGNSIRKYSSFNRFINTDDFTRTLIYALDPESLGKANIIYSIYNLKELKNYLIDFLNSPWASVTGSDMAMMLGALARSKIEISEQILFKKRLVLDGSVKNLNPPYPHLVSLDKGDFEVFKNASLYACKDTSFSNYLEIIFNSRSASLNEFDQYSKKLHLVEFLKKIYRSYFKKKS